MRRNSNYLLPNSDGSGWIALLSARSLRSESVLLHVLQPNMSIPNSQMMMYTRLQVSDELLQIYKGQLCPLDHRQSHLGPISRLQDNGQPYFPRASKHSPKTKSHPQIPSPPLSKTFRNHTTASSHIKSLGMDHSHPTDDSSSSSSTHQTAAKS